MAMQKYEIYKDVAGKFRFRLRASNNKIVAVGEAYETKDGCLNGVHAIKKYCGAEIEDLTTGQILEEPTRGVPKEAVIEDLTAGETTLILDRPPSKALKGSTVTFTGKLIREGKGVAGAKIGIYDRDRSFMKDDYMASGHTLEDGTFNIGWEAKETDWWDNTVEVYAKFEGTASHKRSRSKQYVITVWSSKILGGSQL